MMYISQTFTTTGHPGSIEILDLHSQCTNINTGYIFLTWTPPTDSGGQNMIIEHYLINITGPAKFTCPADQCNVTTTNTSITDLSCNTSYAVSVKAVSCIGEGNFSQPVIIYLPGKGMN